MPLARSNPVAPPRCVRKVAGTLVKVDFKEGRDVDRGDILFEVGSPPVSKRPPLRRGRSPTHQGATRHRTGPGRPFPHARRRRPCFTGAVSDHFRFRPRSPVPATRQRGRRRQRPAPTRLLHDPLAARRPHRQRCRARGDLVRVNDAGGQLVSVHQISPINVTFSLPQRIFGSLVAIAPTAPSRSRLSRRAPTIGRRGRIDVHGQQRRRFDGHAQTQGHLSQRPATPLARQVATVTVTLDAPEVMTVASSAYSDL